ncbi:MAG: sugar transferase [Bacteroidales bacterium]|nr:sugar transferase [Bacteroidales bacterium]
MAKRNTATVWVVGTGPRGLGFARMEGEREGCAVEYADMRDIQNGKVSLPAGSDVYVVPQDEHYPLLPSFFPALCLSPEVNIHVAESEDASFRFPYFRGERVKRGGIVFLEFPYRAMGVFPSLLKRFFDIVFCSCLLLLLLPVLLVSAVLVKCSSKGPVFYSQTRIGLRGKTFEIYKFRSMREGAEQNGPLLSKKGDPRITEWGEIMRKYRIDELPQLWNVLKGDMALVGYRPEREFFIHEIVKVSPYYTLLYALKPGITSLGITTFGYAENVEQMLVRLEEDMAYWRCLSLKEDLRVCGKTVKVVLYGIGK